MKDGFTRNTEKFYESGVRAVRTVTNNSAFSQTNAELEKKLKEMGAKMASSVSKNTFAVVVKDSEGDETGKVLDAKKLGVMVVSLDEFIINFHL
jgi:NAD-dependent DNA ligase